MLVKLVGINGRYTHSCLALFYVRNELEAHCQDIRLDIGQYTINDPYYELLLDIAQEKPEYIFFSALIWNSDLVIKLMRDLLVLSPKSQLVVGGPQAEVVGEAVAGSSIVSGAIERVEPSFYEDLQSGKLGARYREEGGKYTFAGPYRDEDFSSHLLNRQIYYESSRGCPFSCTYCLSSAKKGVYHKELQQVFEELEHIVHHNPKVVRFVDRTFNDSPERALAIWQFLGDLQCSTTFHFEICPQRFTEAMFRYLSTISPGKFQFEIGIQSTNEATLAAIHRPIDTNEAHSTVRRLRQMNNIHLHVDLILGLPEDDRSTFLRSLKEVFSMEPHYIQMGLLKILPDTPISRSVKESGYRHSVAPPYPVFCTKWMGTATLQRLYWLGECVERFLNNRYFVSLWDYLRQQSVDVVSFFEGLLELSQRRGYMKRAPTQELLASILVEFTKDRGDAELVKELIRYDWLRCGHRFFPEALSRGLEPLSKELRKEIFHHLNTLADKEEANARIMRLKKGFVVPFSKTAVEVLKIMRGGEGQYFLLFMNEREESLYGYCRVEVLKLPWEFRQKPKD